MSYMLLFSFKFPPSDYCLSLKLSYPEIPVMLQEVKDNSGIYLLGDGHSSQTLINTLDVKQGVVTLHNFAIDFFKCEYKKGSYPSLLVSYASGGVLDSYRPRGKVKVDKDELDEKFSFHEQYKYSIY